jgi:hypothetical protein
MRVKEYVSGLVDKFGKDYTIQCLKQAVEHHTKIYQIHKSHKSITTINFFNNCLNEFNV